MTAPVVLKEGPVWFKRAQRGLFAGKTRMSGNHVSASKRQCVTAARAADV